MSKIKKDGLLTTAKVVLVIAEILLGFSMVMVLIGAGAVLTVARGDLVAEMNAAHAPGSLYWAIIAVLLLIGGMLFLSVCFVRQLKQIVNSVDEGDPFRPENADRLTRMGWLALGVQVFEFLIAPIASAYAKYGDAIGSAHVHLTGNGDVSLTGAALALVTFILARVFRQGTSMREDLQGTV